MYSFNKPAGLVALLLFMASCSTTNSGSVSKLRHMSPLEADPAAFAITMAIPSALKLKEGDARFELAWSERGGKKTAVAGDLVVKNLLPAESDLPDVVGQGRKIVSLALDEGGIAAIRTAQDQIKARKQSGAKGEGSLSLSLNGGCWQSDIERSGQPRVIDVFLRVQEGGDYLHLIRKADLDQMLRQAGISSIPNCAPDA